MTPSFAKGFLIATILAVAFWAAAITVVALT